MRATFERPLITSCLGEHRAHGRDMIVASRVRRAGERNLLVAQAQAVGSAAFDERQGLQRLDGGAGINRPLCVAEGDHNSAVRIDDRAHSAMSGFNQGASQDLDDHGIGHVRSPDWRRGVQRLPRSLVSGQRFKVTQAMNAPVPSAPMAMRPNSGTSNGARTILPP